MKTNNIITFAIFISYLIQLTSCSGCFDDDHNDGTKFEFPEECQEICIFQGKEYSEGSEVCMINGISSLQIKTCRKGQWAKSNKSCTNIDQSNGTSSTNQKDCFLCTYENLKYSMGSRICQDGIIKRCNKGTWINTLKTCK